MESLQEFHRIIGNPAGYAKGWKESHDKKILGYFCSYTPEEIIFAAGMHPMRLFGKKGNITHADAYLQAYSCSLVRGALEDALSGGLSFLDGAVFPHTCDSIQRLSDIWRLNTSFSLHADVVLPVKLDTDSAKQYMADVLAKFRRDLEKDSGIKISDDMLKKSISTYNSIRKSLHRIYEIRSEFPSVLSGADVYAIVKASMIMDRSELADRLQEIVASLESAKLKAAPAKGKRIVLSGGICDHPEVFELIEKSGGVVVWDDLCTGTRYFEGEIDEQGDPIDAIARRYSGRVVCPAKYVSLTNRGDNLVKMAKERKAEGVIFLLLKFCDPHSFDYPYMKEFLDKEKIPSMLLEIEQELPSEGQVATRFEAFIEML